jgi:hypothetical protein
MYWYGAQIYQVQTAAGRAYSISGLLQCWDDVESLAGTPVVHIALTRPQPEQEVYNRQLQKRNAPPWRQHQQQ